MITKADDYFTQGCGRCERFATPDCSTRLWSAALDDLRRICRGVGLLETVKWGHPCYMHAGRNIALLGAFRGDCRITFFHAALMSDPDGLLEKPGPNTRHANLIRIVEDGQAARLEPAIRAYLKEAMGYAQAGIEPPREPMDVDLPDELTQALDCDPELAEAFHRLTPGRRKSYVINLISAKASATRIARISNFRDRIIAGLGANELR